MSNDDVIKYKIIRTRGEEEKEEKLKKEELAIKSEVIKKEVEKKVRPKPIKRKNFLIYFVFLIIPLVIFFLGFKLIFNKFPLQQSLKQKEIEEVKEENNKEIKPILGILETSTLTSAPEISLPTTSPTSEIIAPATSIITSTETILTESTETTESTTMETTSTLEVPTITQPVIIQKEEEKAPPSTEIQPNQEEIEAYGSGNYIYLDLPLIKIQVSSLTEEGFKKAWLDFLKQQKKAGSIYEIKFYYHSETLDSSIVKNHFLQPSFIEKKYVENFKDNLGSNYKILVYYSRTRKYPIIIFEIKNELVILPFLRLWDKETLLKDISNFYLGLPKGRLIRNYTISDEYQGVKYRIAYFNNDYKFIWTIYNKNLIFSTSLNGFKYIINKIK